MDEDRHTVVKFDPAAKRKKKLNGGSDGGSDNQALLKIAATAVLIATVALGYYALYFIGLESPR